MRTPHEQYETVIVHRSLINPVAYNPRFITRPARKRLAEGLKEFGLVEQLVWNRRTGNLVGGHQRLADLDKSAGSLDYELEVAAVDKDLIEEKRLNLTLNSPFAQGEYNLEGVVAIVKETGYEGTGFDYLDLQLFNVPDAGDLFSEDPAQGLINEVTRVNDEGKAYEAERIAAGKDTPSDDPPDDPPDDDDGDSDSGSASKEPEQPKQYDDPAAIEKMKEIKRKHLAQVRDANANLEFYTIIMFDSDADFAAVRAMLSAPEDNYLDGDALRVEIASRIEAQEAKEMASAQA